MLALKSYPKYTYKDYSQWEGQWELIDGLPYSMIKEFAIQHQEVLLDLFLIFQNAIKDSGIPDYMVYFSIDFKINDTTVVRPDICIVSKRINKEYLDFAPELVIEILSPSTKEKDRYIKLPMYQTQGIKWYLIVDIDKEKLEIYQIIEREYELVFTLHEGVFPFDFDKKCKIKVDFTNLW